ncbi:SpoIIE family protein phosphatase [Streptomyces sp. G35A]
MHHGPPSLLLVDVPRPQADTLRAELGGTTDIADSTAEDVLAHTGGTPGRRRPTVVVLGEDVVGPAGLIHSLRPHPADLAVAVTTTPGTEAELAVLPLLFPTDVVRRIHDGGGGRTPDVVRDLMRQLTRRRDHAAAQAAAAAQHQRSSAASLGRQLGERLLGQFLTQAPIGALMLDGDEMIAWNHRAGDVLDLTEPHSLRRPVADLFAAAERDALHRHLHHRRHRGAVEPDAVFERTRADGTSQALRIAAQQVVDTDGRGRTLLLVEDVTDRLHAQRRLAERTSHALLTAEVAAAMTAPGPLDERLLRCVRAARERLGADRVCIWTRNTLGELVHAVCTEDDDTAGPVSCRNGQRALVEHVVTARRPHLDTAPRPEADADADADASAEDTLLLAGHPLVSGGELIGVLSLATRRALPGSVLDTLENIAAQIAVGTQQDRLLQRLSEATRALERPLLPPRLPDLPGFDVGAGYAPFSQGLHIGGDFYDAFTAPDGRHVLVLGDVCGKGPDAAAITGLVRHTLWAAAQHTSDPTHVLGLINSALRRQNTPFCTLVYAVVDPTRTPARLRVACAGHPAPLLRRADGGTTPLEVHGPLLGVLETTHHPVTEVRLHPGDTLVLYTDGFTEGAGGQDRREPEDLAAVAASLPLTDPRSPAGCLAAGLLEDAHRWWGERLRDDLAVLALTALPAPAGTS